jgi:hypothetical protein
MIKINHCFYRHFLAALFLKNILRNDYGFAQTLERLTLVGCGADFWFNGFQREAGGPNVRARKRHPCSVRA